MIQFFVHTITQPRSLNLFSTRSQVYFSWPLKKHEVPTIARTSEAEGEQAFNSKRVLTNKTILDHCIHHQQ